MTLGTHGNMIHWLSLTLINAAGTELEAYQTSSIAAQSNQ